MIAAQVAARTTVHGAVLIAPAIVVDRRTASPAKVREAPQRLPNYRFTELHVSSFLPTSTSTDLRGAVFGKVLPARWGGRYQPGPFDARPGEGEVRCHASLFFNFGPLYDSLLWRYAPPRFCTRRDQLDEFLDDKIVFHHKARARWAVNLLREMSEVEHHNIQVCRSVRECPPVSSNLSLLSSWPLFFACLPRK